VCVCDWVSGRTPGIPAYKQASPPIPVISGTGDEKELRENCVTHVHLETAICSARATIEQR